MNIKGKIIAGDYEKQAFKLNTSVKNISIRKDFLTEVVYAKNDIAVFEKASEETVRKFWRTGGGIAGGAVVGAVTLGLLTGGIGTLAGAFAGGLVCGKRQQFIFVFTDGKKCIVEIKP